jgi:hypothetical protein
VRVSPTKLSQHDRVLAALRTAGSRGITQSMFAPAEGGQVVDGGGRITRIAARVHELREEGYTIVKAGRREHFDVYVLTGYPSPEQGLLCEWRDGWVRRYFCNRCFRHTTRLIGPVCACGTEARIGHEGPWLDAIPAWLNPPATERRAA